MRAQSVGENCFGRKRELLNQLQSALSSAAQSPPALKQGQCSVQTFWGDAMTVILPEVVSTDIAASGAYEIDLTIALILLLEPGMIFFDVGAHRGYFSLLAARLVGPTGQVHAFEPTAGSYELLTLNAGPFRNVRTNNLAVYSESKELVFHDYGLLFPAFNSIYAPRLPEEDAARISIENCSVMAVSIDDYVETSGVRPSFIKIDAESAEMDILRGMAETLRTIRPAFTLETGDADIEGVVLTRDLVRFACSFDYTPFDITRGQICIHEIHERYGPSNLLFIPSEQLARN